MVLCLVITKRTSKSLERQLHAQRVEAEVNSRPLEGTKIKHRADIDFYSIV